MAWKRVQPEPGAPSRRLSVPRKNTGGAGDDAALWGQIAGTVKPLKRRRAAPPPAKPTGDVKPAAEAPVETPVRSAKPHPPEPAHAPPAPLAPGAASGLDKRTAQRLRRGQIRIEGRIDLHGMTQVEAYRNLSDFLQSSATAGRRCVLVITGKGMRGGAGSGILRSEFPRWLNEAALRPLILGFTAAQPKDGGGGAFYVYLRRHRAS